MKFSGPLRIAIVAFASVIQTSAAWSEIAWKESYYNPNPRPDDLILPMPCGGAMAFRPVETPNTDGMIGDVRVTLGQEGKETPYLNGLRRSYVSGGFRSDGDNPKGLFYLGKYEVAEAQWLVVMEGCPEKKFRKRGFVPVTERSPLQMALFAEKYTLWLMREAENSLPQAEETSGFLRLPTEDEWEFAARGGLVVSDVEFRTPRPPIPDSADQSEYIAHGGTESAGGKVQVIGTLNSNPLGLHDMLGNVAEIVDTPFALVRHGRLHGQAGGIVKRGGDARTPLGSITSATRFEVPPYSVRNKTPFSDRFTGFRLTIAGLAIPSAQATEDMIDDLGKIADSTSTIANTDKDVDDILNQLEEQMDTPQGRSQVAVVRDTIAASRAERNAQNNQSIRLVMESGTHICDQIVGRLRNAQFVTSQLQEINDIEQEILAIDPGSRTDADNADLADIPIVREETQAKLQEILDNLDRDLEDFGGVVEGLADDNQLSHLLRQSTFIAPDVEAGGERRKQCLSALEDGLADRVSKGFTDVDWLEDRLGDIANKETQNP